MKIIPGKSDLAAITALLLVFASITCVDGQSNPTATNNPPAQPSTPAPPPAAPVVPADVQAAMALPDGPPRRTALAAAVKAWAQSDPAAAVTWSAQLTDKPLQRLALESATSIWIANDEKAATAWALNQGSGVVQHFIFGAYGAKNGQAGAEWIIQQPKHNPGELGVCVEAWCGHPFNPANILAAKTWVLQQKLSPADTTAALHFVVSAIAWTNPPDAAAWVLQLPATVPRLDAAQNVANIWSRKIPADLPKIQAWIAQLPLPEDQKAVVAKSIVTK